MVWRWCGGVCVGGWGRVPSMAGDLSVEVRVTVRVRVRVMGRVREP